MTWTEEELVKIMRPAYTFRELWEISQKKINVVPETIARAARRLAAKGVIESNVKKRKARIVPEDGVKILNEVHLKSGNPNWTKKG
jgi:hypothetical protein